MAHGLGADSHARSTTQLLHAIQARFLSRYQNVREPTLGSSQVDQLVDVIENAGRVKDAGRHEASRHSADRQPVGTARSVNEIRRLLASTARHVLDNDGRISWNMFPQ